MATSVGNLFVDVRLNTAPLANDLRGALRGAGAAAGADAGSAVTASLGQRLQTIGTSLGNVGRQVSLGLSLPLIAFGKAAEGAFVQFDTAMTQVTTLSGVARGVVADWTDDVMNLGGTYGVAADDAAQALYFITSSGVDAADALGVLDVAAKSSALGLGSAKVAADVVTSALNQYGKENITAAEAADILTVAVREGKGEADQMAGALARVIPLAGSMGVKFGEVAGVMSAMTLSGTSADEAATQINALLTTFQKMPKHAQEDMKALTGLDYATVQQDLSTKGLTETLREIYNAFGDNQEIIGKVFGNVRALRGITNLFGEKEAQTMAVVQQTTHAVGAQDKAMQELAGSKAFEMKQAQANLSNAMTNIGGMVTPVFAKLTGGLAGVLSAVQFLPSPLQTAAVGLGTLAAAAGPLLYVGASVTRLTGNIVTLGAKLTQTGAFQGAASQVLYLKGSLDAAAASGSAFAKSTLAMGAAMGPLAVGVTAAVVSFQVLNSIIHANDEAFAQLGRRGEQKVAATTSFKALNDEITRANAGIAEQQSIVDQMNSKGSGFEGLANMWNLGIAATRQDAVGAGLAFQQMGAAAVKTRDQAIALADAMHISRDAAAAWISAQVTAGRTFNTNKEAIDGYTAAVKTNDASVQKAAADTERQKNSLAGVIAATKDTSDAFFAVINAQKAYEASQKAIVDAKEKVVDAENAHKDAVRGVVDAQRKVVEADRKVIESGEKVADARQKAADAQKRLNDLLAGPSPSERLDVRSAQLALKEAQEGLKGKNLTPLERERAQIGVERARLDLAEAQKAHEEAIADARKDVKSATDNVADAEQARQDAITAAADSRVALQTARDKEHQSLLDIGQAQRDVSQAELDAVGPAMALTTEQQKLVTMFSTGTIEADKFRDYLTRLKDLYPELATELQKYMDKFDELQKQAPPPPAALEPKSAADLLGGSSITATERANPGYKPYVATPTETAGGDVYIPGVGYRKRRAMGGPVSGGQLYEVNEANVPELLQSGGHQFLLPVDSGQVVPLTKGEGKGGGDLNVAAINVYGADAPVQTAYEIRRQLRSKRDLVGRR